MTPVRVLICASQDALRKVEADFVGHDRFLIVSRVTDPTALPQALQDETPDVAVVYARMFNDAAAMRQALEGFEGTVILILPRNVHPAAMSIIQSITNAQGNIFYEMPPPGKLAEHLAKLFPQRPPAPERPSTSASAKWPPYAQSAPWRAILVWNVRGGVGRSTVAEALAVEAAQRGFPVLLVGLGAPDLIPLRLGIHVSPGLPEWSDEAPVNQDIGRFVQKAHGVDVLPGFPSYTHTVAFAARAMDQSSGLPALVSQAAFAGYRAIILAASTADASIVGPAIAVANTLLVVTEPTPEGRVTAADTLATVFHHMAGQHYIRPENAFLVLNKCRSRVDVGQFARRIAEWGGTPPAIGASIPYDEQITKAHNSGQAAALQSQALREASAQLADVLFGPSSTGTPREHRPPTSRGFLGLFKGG